MIHVQLHVSNDIWVFKRKGNKNNQKQSKISLIRIIGVFFFKETKAIPFPTNFEVKDLLHVDFVAFLCILFYFSYGFLENESYVTSSFLLMDTDR